MKRNIRILLYYAGLSVVLLATADSLHVDHAPWLSSLTQTLPQQAMMCDMAGVGYIHENSGTQTLIDVVAYWFGSPGTNRVPVQVVGFDLIPAIPTNTLCVFMASTNDWWNATICEDAAMFSWSFVTNRPSAGAVFSQWSVVHPEQSIFPTSVEDWKVCAFISNLVYAARIQQNSTNFYDLICSGATSKVTRVYRDSRSYVFYCRSYLPSNVVTFVDSVIEQAIRNRQQ